MVVTIRQRTREAMKVILGRTRSPGVSVVQMLLVVMLWTTPVVVARESSICTAHWWNEMLGWHLKFGGAVNEGLVSLDPNCEGVSCACVGSASKRRRVSPQRRSRP